MKTKLLMITLVIGFWMGFNQVQAVPITIQITGKVTDGYGSLWGSDIYVGTSFCGTYTYDSSTPNTSDSDMFGVYVHDSPYGLNVSLGGFEFKTVPNHIGQFKVTVSDNGPNGDYYKFDSSQNNLLSNGATVKYFFWKLDDSAISSTALPFVAPDVEQCQGNLLYIWGVDINGNGYLIRGEVTKATPEPITGLLLAIGVFYLRRK